MKGIWLYPLQYMCMKCHISCIGESRKFYFSPCVRLIRWRSHVWKFRLTGRPSLVRGARSVLPHPPASAPRPTRRAHAHAGRRTRRVVSSARPSRAERGSGELPIVELFCTAPKTGWSRNAITRCGFHNNVVLRNIMPAVQLVAS